MKLFSSIGKARILTILVGIGAFFLFRATLHEGFFPGESARQASIAMQLEPGIVSFETTQVEKRSIASFSKGTTAKVNATSVTTDTVHFRTKRIFWRLVSSFVAALPLGQIPISQRLNGFCALIGAICAALAFALGRGLTLFLSFHATPLSAKSRKHASVYAGLVGAVLLSTAMPFWISSTRCSPYPFQMLLLLCMGYALLRAAISHRTFPLLVFGILFGINIFEWQVGLFIAPILLFFAFRAMLVGEINDAYGVTNVLVGIVIGVLGYLIACRFFLVREGVSFFLAFKEILFSIKYGTELLFHGGTFENNPMLVSCCFAVLPFLAMVAMAIWRDVDSATSSSGLLLFALACTFSICALDVSISPWGANRIQPGNSLPVTSYLLNAAIGAYLAGQGALMAGGRFLMIETKKRRGKSEFDDDDDGTVFEAHRDSPVGRILLWYVVIFTICTVCWNGMKIKDWNDSLLDRTAASTARELEDRTWILTENNALSSLLRVRANLLGKRIVVFNPEDDRAFSMFRNAIDMKANAFKSLPKEDIAKLRNILSTTNAAAFVSKWIVIDPDIGSKLEVMRPEDITLTGKEAIPSIFGFHAAVQGVKTDWVEIADRHLAFWHEIASLPPLGKDAPLWLRSDRAKIRQQLVLVGKYLADKLVKESRVEKAQEVLAAIDIVSEEPIAPTGPAVYQPLY